MAARRDYLRHLAGAAAAGPRHRRQAARPALHYRHPGPGPAVVDGGQLPGVGAAPGRPATSAWSGSRSARRRWPRRWIPPLTRPLEDLEPMTAGALRRFLDAYSVVPDLPVAISLRGFARVFLRGRRRPGTRSGGRPRPLARAMLAQLAVFHAPDDLLIAVCAGPDRRAAWEWVKWLPHALHPARTDALGPVRLVASSGRGAGGAARRRARQPAPVRPGRRRRARAAPHVVVVLDGGDLAGARPPGADGGIDGVTVLDLDGAPPRLLDRSPLVLDRRPGGGGHVAAHVRDGPRGRGRARPTGSARPRPRRSPGGWRRCGWPPSASRRRHAAGRRARPGRAARHRRPGDVRPSTQGWAPRPEPRPAAGADRRRRRRRRRSSWTSRSRRRTAWARTACSSAPPARASRSCCARWCSALAATHSSETLNFVLVDFKGGATFASLDRLPHTAAVITNLADELPLVDRMTDAINGELIRRQELLRRRGQLRLPCATTSGRGPAVRRSPPLPSLLRGLRRVLRAAVGQAGLHRPVRPDRPARPVARRAPAAGLASGWRRAGCAGWTRTCRTGSACGRSRRWSRGRCSACRTRTSCPARPGTAT